MVFGMSLGGRKKPAKAPDLSRYNYHYNGASDSGGAGDGYIRSHELSADAAFAASVNSNVRTGSMLNYSQRPSQAGYGGSRANSLRMGNPGQPSYVPRSYSLMSRGPPVSRAGSMSNRRSVSAVPRTGVVRANAGRGGAVNRTGSMTGSVARGGSRTSSFAGGSGSIIIKTQEVKDMLGRTQSITTQTIRRVNGMEFVETTTQTAGPVEDAQYHFQQFAENDEFPLPDEVSPSPPVSPAKPGNRRKLRDSRINAIHSPTVNEARSDSEGEEEFADASEVVEESDLQLAPEDEQDHFLAKVNKVDVEYVPRSRAVKNKQESVKQRQQQQQQEQQQQEQLLPQAQQLPQQQHQSQNRVKTQVKNPEVRPIARKSTMSKRMTLRGAPDLQVESEIDAANQPASQNNKRLSLFKSKKRSEGIPVPELSEQNSQTPEEMYAQALEIAQQKHGKTVRASRSIDAGSRNEMTPILEDSDVEHTVLPTTEKISLPEPQQEQQQQQQQQHYATAVPTNENSRHPKKKVKSLLDKVVQFSQENSGNQPPRQRGKQHSQQPVDVPASNASPRANSRLNNSTSSSSSLRHGSTTGTIVTATEETEIVTGTAVAPVASSSDATPGHVVNHVIATTVVDAEINDTTKAKPKKKKNEKVSFFKRLFKSNKTHINTT